MTPSRRTDADRGGRRGARSLLVAVAAVGALVTVAHEAGHVAVELTGHGSCTSR